MNKQLTLMRLCEVNLVEKRPCVENKVVFFMSKVKILIVKKDLIQIFICESILNMI